MYNLYDLQAKHNPQELISGCINNFSKMTSNLMKIPPRFYL